MVIRKGIVEVMQLHGHNYTSCSLKNLGKESHVLLRRLVNGAELLTFRYKVKHLDGSSCLVSEPEDQLTLVFLVAPMFKWCPKNLWLLFC